MVIEVKELYKRYAEKEVLRNINIELRKGETFAIIGPTGAGKTTLLRLLNLLEAPSRGEIYFDGVSVTKNEKIRLNIRRRMAMVFQKPVVFKASVYDNVAYGLKVRGKDDIAQKVRDVLEMVGLSGDEKRSAQRLSGGEVQRVALARAMVTEPEVLLLDEPTANLDPISAEKIEELIFHIGAYKTTIIMATHDISQGRRVADRISVLMDGEIVQVGTPDEVFNAPINEQMADFVGVENIIEGVIASCEDQMTTICINGRRIEAVSTAYSVGDRVRVCFRGEDVTLAFLKGKSSARNSFPGTITQILPRGALAQVKIDCGFPLHALVTKRSVEDLGFKEGDSVSASLKATAIHLIRQ